MSANTIYKISPRSDWEAAVAAGSFAGAPVDLADGFIHFSTAAQVARRHRARPLPSGMARCWKRRAAIGKTAIDLTSSAFIIFQPMRFMEPLARRGCLLKTRPMRQTRPIPQARPPAITWFGLGAKHMGCRFWLRIVQTTTGPITFQRNSFL